MPLQVPKTRLNLCIFYKFFIKSIAWEGFWGYVKQINEELIQMMTDRSGDPTQPLFRLGLSNEPRLNILQHSYNAHILLSFMMAGFMWFLLYPFALVDRFSGLFWSVLFRNGLVMSWGFYIFATLVCLFYTRLIFPALTKSNADVLQTILKAQFGLCIFLSVWQSIRMFSCLCSSPNSLLLSFSIRQTLIFLTLSIAVIAMELTFLQILSKHSVNPKASTLIFVASTAGSFTLIMIFIIKVFKITLLPGLQLGYW